MDFTPVSDKQCRSCKNTLKEHESTYLKWQRMYFCNIMCLHVYQKENLIQNCSNCFSNLSPDMVGKFVFRFDQLLQFCSIPCFQKYQATRKSCIYCMGKILSFSVKVVQHNPLYCSQECFVKHHKSQGVATTVPGLEKICSICGSKNHPIKFHYQSGVTIKGMCNQSCLQSYAYSLTGRIILCASCKIHFSPNALVTIKMVCKDTTFTFCSKKCENYMIFANLKIYPCAYCDIQRFDIDLIQRCSKIEPFVYMCSIECYLKKYYCTARSQPTMPQWVSLNINKATIANQTRKSSSQVSNHTTNFGSSALPPIIEENVVMEANSINPITTKSCFIIKSARDPQQHNVATMCSVIKTDKSSCVKPKTFEKESQTDFPSPKKMFIPVPVPIYVPAPMHMYSVPLPSPVPFPLPIPVPVLLPTTKEGFKKISEDVEKLMDHSPANAVEADILAMAEAVSKDNQEELENELILGESAVDAMFSDDLLDSVAISNPPLAEVPIHQGSQSSNNYSNIIDKNSLDTHIGVHALRQWGKLTKSVVLADSSTVDILGFSSSELAACLSIFICEVRRPNGKSYAPDTIFYLCLSIQKYLFEHGRLDNIFFDVEYNGFIGNLDSHMRMFALLFVDSPFIVTRVEEEHLWESRQLGAHSPFILLNTILYNNMKYFQLMGVEENLSLPRLNIKQTNKTGKGHKGESQTVLHFLNKELKYKCEMKSNSNNPDRCPIRLFELYCSKLPSTGKLAELYFMPETSCSTDSPIWYSTETIDKNLLEIMMNRLKVVKELNVSPIDEE